MRLGHPLLLPAMPHEAIRLEDRQYLLMTTAYERHGGLLSADTVARLMRPRRDQALSKLARWIVNRTAVHLVWRTETIMPVFQFTPGDMTLRPEVVTIVEELTPAFDDWDVAVWFAEPNTWLDDQAPVDVLRADPSAVLHAARADRYIATG